MINWVRLVELSSNACAVVAVTFIEYKCYIVVGTKSCVLMKDVPVVWLGIVSLCMQIISPCLSLLAFDHLDLELYFFAMVIKRYMKHFAMTLLSSLTNVIKQILRLTHKIWESYRTIYKIKLQI